MPTQQEPRATGVLTEVIWMVDLGFEVRYYRSPRTLALACLDGMISKDTPIHEYVLAGHRVMRPLRARPLAQLLLEQLETCDAERPPWPHGKWSPDDHKREQAWKRDTVGALIRLIG